MPPYLPYSPTVATFAASLSAASLSAPSPIAPTASTGLQPLANAFSPAYGGGLLQQKLLPQWQLTPNGLAPLATAPSPSYTPFPLSSPAPLSLPAATAWQAAPRISQPTDVFKPTFIPPVQQPSLPVAENTYPAAAPTTNPLPEPTSASLPSQEVASLKPLLTSAEESLDKEETLDKATKKQKERDLHPKKHAKKKRHLMGVFARAFGFAATGTLLALGAGHMAINAWRKRHPILGLYSGTHPNVRVQNSFFTLMAMMAVGAGSMAGLLSAGHTVLNKITSKVKNVLHHWQPNKATNLAK